MLLAIDIGNSNIALGCYDNDVLTFTSRIATSAKHTASQYAIELKDILALYNQDYKEIDDCIICSVVPSVGATISKAVSLLCDIVPLSVGPGVKTGLNIKIDNPAQLGADLVAGAVGAISEYTLPCVVIDMGTASTISIIDSDGSFLGAVISAGVKLTLKALTENTAQLPSINITAPKSVIGKNSVDSMRSGLVFGTAGMLDGLIDRITEELGVLPTIVATGGLAKEIIIHCKNDIIYNENLLLDGLREIYERNK